MALANIPAAMNYDRNYRRWMLLLVVGILLLTSLITANASAQRPVIEGAAGIGSGLSLGTGNGQTVVMMSPIYLDIDLIFYNDERPKLEWVVGFQAELQGRVSAGVVPQIRLTNAPKRWMLYGIVGVPLVFAPFVLLGVEAGSGLLFRFTDTIGFYGEVVADLFFLGNDLQEDGMLIQLDSNIGVRIKF